MPDTYDETDQIIRAIDRNEQFQQGSDGQQLSRLAHAARSNLNKDINEFCQEIQRQFGLYAVEVTGDGVRDDRTLHLTLHLATHCSSTRHVLFAPSSFRVLCVSERERRNKHSLTFVSGLQQADGHHGKMREKVVEHVLNDKSYYSTVLRPGDKVTDEELLEWAHAMRDPYTYGDELANIAVSDHWHIQLVIFRAGELLSVINPRDAVVKHSAFLVNVGTHYRALVPLLELPEAVQNSARLNQ